MSSAQSGRRRRDRVYNRYRGKFICLHNNYLTYEYLPIHRFSNFYSVLSVIVAELKEEHKHAEYIRILHPLLMEEILNQQRRHVLIERALSGFADHINNIADKLEGKTNPEYVSMPQA